MSNVFSNASFAVLSVMQTKINSTFQSATAFVQRKPEANYPSITTVSFASAEWDIKDFQVQDRFNANVAPNIYSQVTNAPFANSEVSFISIKSNISAKSYRMSAEEIK